VHILLRATSGTLLARPFRGVWAGAAFVKCFDKTHAVLGHEFRLSEFFSGEAKFVQLRLGGQWSPREAIFVKHFEVPDQMSKTSPTYFWTPDAIWTH
jgi:hypothetical protein